jgi:ankyrin repeat protein
MKYKIQNYWLLSVLLIAVNMTLFPVAQGQTFHTLAIVYPGVYFPPLHHAIADHNYDEAERALSMGADPDEVDVMGETPLYRAINQNNDAIVALLLAAGSDIHKKVFDETPFIRAVQQGDESIVQKLITAGADVNERYGDGLTALHLAVSSGSFANGKLINILLKNKADVNAKDNEGRTALHDAVASVPSYPHSIEKLIRAGAYINAKDNEGNTPRDYAVIRNNKRVIKLFDQYLFKSKEEI